MYRPQSKAIVTVILKHPSGGDIQLTIPSGSNRVEIKELLAETVAALREARQSYKLTIGDFSRSKS